MSDPRAALAAAALKRHHGLPRPTAAGASASSLLQALGKQLTSAPRALIVDGDAAPAEKGGPAFNLVLCETNGDPRAPRAAFERLARQGLLARAEGAMVWPSLRAPELVRAVAELRPALVDHLGRALDLFGFTELAGGHPDAPETVGVAAWGHAPARWEGVFRRPARHQHVDATETSAATIAILLPSRGRPQAALATALSARERAAQPDALCFAVGVEPDEADRYREVFGAQAGWIHGLTEGGNYVRAVRELARATPAPLYGLIGDDFVFETPAWDEAIRAGFADLYAGLGLVYADDGYWHDGLATAPFLSRRWIEVVGDVLVGDYQHLFCDTELTDIARRAGLLSYLPDVKITHNHPLAGKAAYDPTYERSAATHAAGQAEFIRREPERRRLAARLLEA